MQQRKALNIPFGAVAGLIEKDGKFLLVRENRNGGTEHGLWNHPAGMIDAGENPIEAVKREVQEETGHTFTPTYFLGVYSLIKKHLEEELGGIEQPIKLVFTGTISEEPRNELSNDISEIKWFTQEEIEAMNSDTLRDADIKKIVRDYMAGERISLDRVVHTVMK